MAINLLDSTNTSGERYAIIELDINNIYDIVNGLNTLIVQKENEMRNLGGGDSQDQAQLARYKQCLKEMQFVKGNIKE